MTNKFVNNFSTTIASILSPTDTLLLITNAAGLPSLTGGNTCLLTLYRQDGAIESGHEVVRVTNINGLALTIERSVEGAVASQFTVGDRVGMRLTANSVQSFADHEASTGNPHGLTKTDIVLGNVDNTSDINKPVSTAQAAADTAVLQSSKAYADALVTGLWDDRGNYDVSGGVYPTTGGSGPAGSILKGDIWTISVGGILNSVQIDAKQTFRALMDAPGQTPSKWAIGGANTGLDDAIVDNITGRAPSQNAVFKALATKASATTPATQSALGVVKGSPSIQVAGDGTISTTMGAGTITNNPIIVATAGQTEFPVPSGYAVGLLQVYVNGYKLAPVGYSAVNGTSIVLGVAANAGEEIEVVVFSNQAMNAANALTRSTQVATANQTTFNVAYVPNLLLVSVKGTLIPPSDYTASNGTSIVFATGLPLGTEVEFIVFSAMTIANSVPSTGGTITGNLAVTDDVSASSMNGGQLAGLRNCIINGDMRVDQRNNGASQVIPQGIITYTCDRFFTFVTGANVLGQRIYDPSGSKYKYQFNGAVGVTSIAFFQRIESQNSFPLCGKTVVLSAELANTTVGTVYWSVYRANTPDNFTATTLIDSGSFTGVSAEPARYSAAVAIPAAASTGIQVRFGVENQVSGGFSIAEVQLEVASTASPVSTPFEQRPYGMELALCQRYYYSNASVGGSRLNVGAGAVASATGGVIVGFHPVPMRAVPTLTHVGANQYRVLGGNQGTAVTLTTSEGTTTSFSLGFTGVGLTPGVGVIVQSIDAASPAPSISFSAEI